MENKLEIIHTARLFNHVFKVYGTFEEPLFLAKDVAEWIEYDTSSIHKMLASVDEDEKVRKIVPTPGGPQEMWFLTENGLYEVLMLSRKPVAKLFKREVKRILRELRTRGITATPQTIDRIIDVFPANQQRQITVQLSMVLQAVICQQLVPSVRGNLIPAFEIMTMNPAIRNMIRDGKVPQIDGILYSSANNENLVAMDTSLAALCRSGQITEETALAYASNPEMMKRKL